MNTSQIAQIATSLNVSPNQIKRAEEWANVLFVVVVGKGSRFVSKKVLKMEMTQMTRSQLAKKIAADLDCTTKIWEKGGKVRVYLSHRGKDYGFVEITAKGVEFALTGYANNAYGSDIRNSAEGIEINEPSAVVGDVRRLTSEEADQLAATSRGKANDTERALNAMYGRGGWDRWDREDYEG
ncbi:MAG: hypothetical protein RLZZ139_2115 [Cyanobacteriota bacterium]|jgi:hypothetical protein